jgi:hypothetical protein
VGYFERLQWRLLKDIFRQVEAFLNNYEDFIRTTRLFETFSEEWRPLFRNVGLL